MILPQAEAGTGIALGVAWDLGGAVDTGCYRGARGDSAETLRGRSVDVWTVTWSRSTRDSLHLQIASLLGLEAVAKRAARGTIKFDTLVIARAVDFAPRPGNCSALFRDGTPLRPGISALVGARHFSFAAWDSADVSITARIDVDSAKAAAGYSRAVRRTDGVSMEFSGLRWIGAHLDAFTLGTTIDSSWEGPHPFGATRQAFRGTFDVNAGRSAATFRVWSSLRLPGARRDTVSIGDGETFFLGIRRDNETSGSFYRGNLYAVDAGTMYRLKIERLSYVQKQWRSDGQRKDLRNWIAARVGGP